MRSFHYLLMETDIMIGKYIEQIKSTEVLLTFKLIRDGDMPHNKHTQFNNHKLIEANQSIRPSQTATTHRVVMLGSSNVSCRDRTTSRILELCT